MTRRFLPGLALILLFFPVCPADGAKLDIERVNKSVIKVFSVIKKPSYSQPWQSRNQTRGIGSGVIIKGERILTNAHVVNGSVFIEVKKANDPKKYLAYVEAVGHECDLAILKIRDESFFDNTQPLELGDLPRLHDTVSVYGFPTGGAEISITQGIVSRIEQLNYAHSGIDLLGVQIDAAVNPGNSGGPAVIEDKVVGIAMQSLRSGDNIGYIIPTPIIRHFLKDLSDGRYDGFPESGVVVQELRNKFLREYHGLRQDQTGVVVIKVVREGSAWGILKEGDVIVSVDGVQVANDGTVKLDRNLRVAASFLVQKHFIGDKLAVGIIRGGKPVKLDLTLKKGVQFSPLEWDKQPSYYIYGGLVFMPLTDNYLREWGRNWYRKAPMSLMYQANSGLPTEQRRQIVFLKMALAHEINAGYHNYRNMIVNKVNGAEIRDMQDFVKALKESRGGITVIEMDRGERIVMDDTAAREAKEEILTRYGIQSEASLDLM